jgi:hypothetical protein
LINSHEPPHTHTSFPLGFSPHSTVYFRHYYVTLKKSGSRLPRVELAPCGPCFDLTLRRTSFADPALYREAVKQPKAGRIKKIKNIEKDVLGNKLGRVHMEGQDLMEMATKKFKAYDKRRRAEEGKDKGGSDDEGDDDDDAGGDSDSGNLPDPVDFFRAGGDDEEEEAAAAPPAKRSKRAKK